MIVQETKTILLIVSVVLQQLVIANLLLHLVAKVCMYVWMDAHHMTTFYIFVAMDTAICRDGDVRINIAGDYDYFYGETSYDEAYYANEVSGSGLMRGRVEVCNGTTQEWGNVCDDSWNNLDASVACQEVGFSRYGKSCIT
ncbi:MAG: scavenger receptor cysteine-rich domain-containing protein [Methylococcales symbiont of Iophon sp. n. MRB-2018]|nr:MAG: scavenger receptor cysteine-rich domain-containing protein [Methylococcales symbiont of Iophon sp. n. MRB-2018]